MDRFCRLFLDCVKNNRRMVYSGFGSQKSVFLGGYLKHTHPSNLSDLTLGHIKYGYVEILI
jgi:hypothetical protein